MPIHLRPTAPIAADALLPGDPGRALALAQVLLTEPKMANHSRGLWGYSGETTEGRPLTIQSTGMGGPSAAIVLQELAGLGVRRAIRVGTAGALDPTLELGELLRVEGAVAGDGVGAKLGSGSMTLPDAGLLARLEAEGGARPATVWTTDLFYEPEQTLEERREQGAAAVEMEAAPLFALGRRLGVAVACVLAISDIFPGGVRQRIADEELVAAAERMGALAARALSG